MEEICWIFVLLGDKSRFTDHQATELIQIEMCLKQTTLLNRIS